MRRGTGGHLPADGDERSPLEISGAGRHGVGEETGAAWSATVADGMSAEIGPLHPAGSSLGQIHGSMVLCFFIW